MGMRLQGSGAWETCAETTAENLAECTVSLWETWLLFWLEGIGGQQGLALSLLLFRTEPDGALVIHGDVTSTPRALFNSLSPSDK